MRALSVFLACLPTFLCHADWIVNIDARLYGFNAPTDPAPQPGQLITPFSNAPGGALNQLTLPAGRYRVSNATGSAGANPAFIAWNYSGAWVWNFVASNHSSNRVIIYMEAGGARSSANEIAAQPQVQAVSGSFVLTQTTTLDFMIRDYYLADNAGGVAVRITPDCPADFNGDGFADGFDYDDFVACFEGEPCPPGKNADFNGDGFADGFDYDDFVAAFEAGCP